MFDSLERRLIFGFSGYLLSFYNGVIEDEVMGFIGFLKDNFNVYWYLLIFFIFVKTMFFEFFYVNLFSLFLYYVYLSRMVEFIY